MRAARPRSVINQQLVPIPKASGEEIHGPEGFLEERDEVELSGDQASPRLLVVFIE